MSEDPRRPLTEEERRLVAVTFGPLDLERVRLCAGDGGNPFAEIALGIQGVGAVTLIRTIFFKDKLPDDFSEGGDKGLFLHEMTHVWQYQKLGVLHFALRYLWELVTRGFNRRALYDYQPGNTRFADATLEAQAQMAQNYHDARAGGDNRALAEIGRNLAGSGLHGL
ncbi:MAG TPA: DUF4157 domain-containing protein [Allosphingosinicella sp.]|jgi:hypothetical protein|nr:DUF4157 domain-containing protein [Allosphingosinicella sp.]